MSMDMFYWQADACEINYKTICEPCKNKSNPPLDCTNTLCPNFENLQAYKQISAMMPCR